MYPLNELMFIILTQVTELTPCETENPMGGGQHICDIWIVALLLYLYTVTIICYCFN